MRLYGERNEVEWLITNDAKGSLCAYVALDRPCGDGSAMEFRATGPYTAEQARSIWDEEEGAPSPAEYHTVQMSPFPETYEARVEAAMNIARLVLPEPSCNKRSA